MQKKAGSTRKGRKGPSRKAVVVGREVVINTVLDVLKPWNSAIVANGVYSVQGHMGMDNLRKALPQKDEDGVRDVAKMLKSVGLMPMSSNNKLEYVDAALAAFDAKYYTEPAVEASDEGKSSGELTADQAKPADLAPVETAATVAAQEGGEKNEQPEEPGDQPLAKSA